MLDLQFIRTQPDVVKNGMAQKGYAETALIDEILALDAFCRRTQKEADERLAQGNALSKEIGNLMKSGKKEEAEQLRNQSAELKVQSKALSEQLAEAEQKRYQLLLEIPNVPHPSAPIGKSEAENQVVFEWGEKRQFDFEALPHWELIQKHDLIDFERGSKVTGAGFPFYKGKGAKLQRALINFFLNEAGDKGYTELQAPYVVNEASGIGTGQLPDKEGQMYETIPDRFFLIPTAEVPVTNYYRDDILNESDLPIQFCAYTPCFRREAGSYGKDVRGLNRLHQFDKVELVHFVHPDKSYEALELLRENAEALLQKLGLAYHRLLMCTGDMGFTQTKKYDLEVWSAGQSRWLEVSSVSNFESFQARRANIRFRPQEGGKPQFVHTLNGSGLALPRIVAALLENGQQADGSILLSKVLHPYCGFEKIG